MDPTDIVLCCCASIEWINVQGTTLKKINYKNASIKLVRNEIREIFIEISQEKLNTTKLKLLNINVHKNFMSEGKASIKFNNDKCNLFLSNAPTGTLMAFLKTVFIKLTSNTTENKGLSKEQIQAKARAHLLSDKASSFDEISPITNNELERAKKMAISKSTITTPSPPASKKRRLLEGRSLENMPASKKLYTPSPLTKNEPSMLNPDDPVQMENLNEEQKNILNACISGKNVFFTGSAGTGKSFLLKKIIATLPPDGTVATASTGVAACLIGGVTLHSFCGIGIGEASLKRCLELASRPAAAVAWRRCKRLIIDEISMVGSDYFDKIEKVAREIRRNEKPFGGIQMILCGDFFQLPPVKKSDNKGLFEPKMIIPKNIFCFQSKSWQSCIQISFELKKVHRQKDPEFISILNSIRIGLVTPEISEKLLATSRQHIEENGILATQLCSHTNQADSINKNKLENLETPTKTFEAVDSDSYLTTTLDSQLPVPYKLILKIGAQVMLLKNLNLSNGLVNGARGIVIKYDEGLPVVKFKNKVEYMVKPEKWSIKTPSGAVLTRKQIPLKLAWAFSIHKSQGLTLDCVEMSLSNVFEAGQAYVALSRAQSMQSLRVKDFDAKQIWASPDVLRFYKSFRRQIMDMPIPLGVKKQKKDVKSILGNLKLSKKMLDKPLMTIN